MCVCLTEVSWKLILVPCQACGSGKQSPATSLAACPCGFAIGPFDGLESDLINWILFILRCNWEKLHVAAYELCLPAGAERQVERGWPVCVKPPCRIGLGHTITSMCSPEACRLLPSERATTGKQAEGRSEKLLLTVYLKDWFVCKKGKQSPCLCAAA